MRNRLLVGLLLLGIGAGFGFLLAPFAGMSTKGGIVTGMVVMILYALLVTILFAIDSSVWLSYLFTTAIFVFLRLIILDATNPDANAFEMLGAMIAGCVYGLAGFMLLGPTAVYVVTGEFGTND